MSGRLAEKTCVLTGGARGVGRATALRLGDEGAHVIIGDIDLEGAEKVIAEIETRGGSGRAVRIDVTRPADLEGLAATAEDDRPSIDLVFANAGVLDPARIEELDVERFRRTLDANLVHPFVLVRETASALRASGGSAVLMSSAGGLRGIVGQAAYSASKAGVINLTRVLAAELGPEARVNCICPGWVDTPFNDPLWELMGGRSREPELMARVPLGRQGTPDEIAGAVLFLASEDAGYVTGHALVADGGATAI